MRAPLPDGGQSPEGTLNAMRSNSWTPSLFLAFVLLIGSVAVALGLGANSASGDEAAGSSGSAAATAAQTKEALQSGNAKSIFDEAGGSAPSKIACLQDQEFRYFSRPVSCAFFARQFLPNGLIRRYRDIRADRLKWTNWGKGVAVGVGIDEFELPLTVVAFHRRRCPDGRWYYGRVFAKTTARRDQHLRLARCGAKRFPPLKASDFPPA
jgi:hypothetical protein